MTKFISEVSIHFYDENRKIVKTKNMDTESDLRQLSIIIIIMTQKITIFKSYYLIKKSILNFYY